MPISTFTIKVTIVTLILCRCTLNYNPSLVKASQQFFCCFLNFCFSKFLNLNFTFLFLLKLKIVT